MRSSVNRLFHVFGKCRRRVLIGQRAHGCLLVQRIAQLVLGQLVSRSLEKRVIQTFVYVNTFDRATRLARVMAGAVHKIFDRELQVRLRLRCAGNC